MYVLNLYPVYLRAHGFLTGRAVTLCTTQQCNTRFRLQTSAMVQTGDVFVTLKLRGCTVTYFQWLITYSVGSTTGCFARIVHCSSTLTHPSNAHLNRPARGSGYLLFTPHYSPSPKNWISIYIFIFNLKTAQFDIFNWIHSRCTFIYVTWAFTCGSLDW